MELYLDAARTPRERAADLLPKLSLEEKMAQTGCVLLSKALTDETKAACRYGIGSVSCLDMRNIPSRERLSATQRAYQSYIMAQSPHHIPAIFHMEGVCGAHLQGAASFPSNIGRGASFDPALEEEIGGIVGRQERALGITHTLAPVLDITHDSRLGRQGESYGEDPTLGAALGAAFVRGAQGSETDGRHTDCVAKHFLGFHNSEAGIHGAASRTPRRMREEIYGKPFQAAIVEGGLRGVMPCYCDFDGVPASVDRSLLTELLRGEMGFDGLVVSDYSAIENVHTVQRLYEAMVDAGERSMAAGMDMDWPRAEGFGTELLERFRTGQAPMEILDRAVLRILEAKFRMGLFEHPYALQGQELEAAFSAPTDRAVSLTSARESLVLLKNDGILPLKKCKKIALIGPHAASARSFFGGYTHVSFAEAFLAARNSLAGIGEKAHNDSRTVPLIPGTGIQSDETPEFDEILRRQKPGCRSLLDELRLRLPDTEIVYARGYPVAGDDENGFAEALRALEGADIALVTLGGKHGSCSVATMGEGVDATDINLPPCQDAFLKRAARLGVPMVGLHFNGRPISSDTADRLLAAIVECWNPSECGAEAVVDMLTGEQDPSGRLPVSVARCAGQEPLYYNHPNGSAWHQGESIGFQDYVDCPHTPRYPFGFGLSYTSFRYSDLTLSAAEIAPDGAVEIALTVENIGVRAGTEVVQLYIRDRYASMTRPNRELMGFRRVCLRSGARERVTFRLRASQLAFLDEDYRWKVERGAFDVLVGASSEDIRLTGSFAVTEDQWIDPKTRAFRA